MPVATPFDRFPAHRSGRVKPAAGAVAGDFSFVLGSDFAGEIFDFALGDHAEVSQAVDVTGLSRVTFAARLRGVPAAGGARWMFTWRVDGVVQGSRVVLPARTVLVTDGAFDVSQLAGVHTLALRLEVVA